MRPLGELDLTLTGFCSCSWILLRSLSSNYFVIYSVLIHGAPVLWLPGKTAIWRVRWVVVATVPYTKNTEGSVDVGNGTWYHHTPDGWKVDSNSFILLSLCSIDKNAVWALNLLFVHQSHFPRFSPFIVYAEAHIPWKYVTIWDRSSFDTPMHCILAHPPLVASFGIYVAGLLSSRLAVYLRN